MPGEIEGQFLHFSLTQSLFNVVAASGRDAEVRDSGAHERQIATRLPLSWQETLVWEQPQEGDVWT